MKHVIRMADKPSVSVLVGKPRGKRPLGRPRSGVNDKILYLKVGWFRTGISGRSY